MSVASRCVVSIVVVKMRKAELSVVRQITSSRQSPRRSALSAGVDFEPLLEEQSVAVSRRLTVPVPQSHLSMRLPSRISRRRSPSHQQAKLIDDGREAEISVPLAE